MKERRLNIHVNAPMHKWLIEKLVTQVKTDKEFQNFHLAEYREFKRSAK